MKALIFDMDGVIIDSERYYDRVDRLWFEQHDVHIDWDQFHKALGTTEAVMAEMIRSWNPQLEFEKVLQEYHEHCQQTDTDYSTLYRPYVTELLDQCQRQGIKTALASSSSMKNILQVLSQCGIREKMDLIVSGEDFTVSKPDPQIFLHCAEKLDVRAQDCVVIEDSHNGVLAGKRSGMQVIGLYDPYFDLDLSEADQIIHALDCLEVRENTIIIKKD